MTANRFPSSCLGGAAILLAACTTTHEAFVAADGTAVASLPPAPYRVRLEPIAGLEYLAGPAADPDGSPRLSFRLTGAEFQQRLQRVLRDELDAATDVHIAEATAGGDADLVLRATVTGPPEFAHEGGADHNGASIALWLFTIFGGSFCDDSRYRASVPLACELLDPATRTVIGRFTADSRYVDTRLWDRCTTGGGLLWSLSCLPPCLVSDNIDVTSRSLSEKSTDALAGEIAKQLKTAVDAAAVDHLGCVTFDAPRNGTPVDLDDARLVCSVRTRAPLERVLVWLNSEAGDPVLRLDERELRPRYVRESDGTHRVDLDEALPLRGRVDLRPDVNLLIVRLLAGQVDTSRTLRLGPAD